MLILFIRTIILYLVVILVMRLMGKRQIGELQPYEFVITIMISDLASIPMQDARLPLLLGIIPILTLLLLKILLSQLQLKSQLARRLIDGEPAVLIYKSKINYAALKAQQINIDELLEAIRLAGYFDLEEISYAILETNGRISILPHSMPNDPIDKKFEKDFPKRNSYCENDKPCNEETIHREENIDLIYPSTISGKKSTDSLFLPKILITDGRINRNNLTKLNKDDSWIKDKLLESGVDDIKKVLIALYDTQGQFKYQLFDKYIEEDESSEK